MHLPIFSDSVRQQRKRQRTFGGSLNSLSELCSESNIKETINMSGLLFRKGPNPIIEYDEANEYEEELILKIIKILCEKIKNPKIVLDYLFIVYNELVYIFFIIEGVILDNIRLRKLIDKLLYKKNINLYKLAQDELTQKLKYKKKSKNISQTLWTRRKSILRTPWTKRISSRTPLKRESLDLENLYLNPTNKTYKLFWNKSRNPLLTFQNKNAGILRKKRSKKIKKRK